MLPLGILQLALKFLDFLFEFMNLLVIVVNNFSQVGLLLGKISVVVFRLRLLSYNLVDLGPFRLIIRLTIHLIILQEQQLG